MSESSFSMPSAFGASAAEARGRPAPEFPPLRDLATLLWRRRLAMGAAFAVLAGLGLLAALLAPVRFTAHSSLLIRLGQPYVYQPQVGDAARGAAADNDQVVQSELEILESDAVKIRAIQDIGLARLDARAARAAQAAGAPGKGAQEQAAMRRLASNLKVSSSPGASIARLTFTDRDPVRAALILNTLVDEYLRYRRTVLTDNLGPLHQQRLEFQKRFDEAERSFQAFLARNGIGDFEAEKTSLAQIYSQLLADRYTADASSAEVAGRLGATGRELGRAAPEVGLFHDLDHTAQDRVAQMRVDLADLLSRYLPTADPVIQLQQKIAAAQALIASGIGAGGGALRIGPNPVYQALETEQNQLEAQGASLKDRSGQVARQLQEVTARRQTLEALEPRFQELARQRELLGNNLRSLTQREQEIEASQGLAADGDDGSIKVIERAYPPARGSSLRGPIFIGSLAFAAFAALCLGLFLSALERGFATPEAAGRALRLPVLAAIPAE